MKNRNLTNNDNWKTPKDILSWIEDNFNNHYKFDFDPCPLNHDLSKWDGLKIEWKKENFINPPYSRKLKEAFIMKAFEESKKGKLCVMLLPVSTSTKIFHDIIKRHAKKIEFIRGRIKYEGINTKGEFVKNKCGMHDSMIVVFDGRHER